MKNFDLASIRRDKKKVDEGVEVELCPNFFITLRHRDYAPYREHLQRHGAHLIPSGKKGRMTPSKMAEFEKVQAEATARHLIVGWRGLDIDGEEVPFTVATAVNILTDPEHFEFYELICQESDSNANFRKQIVDDQAKNSE